jgi:hypothetical protein
MKRAAITFSKAFQPSPVSFWVHHHRDADNWTASQKFDPPLPKPVPGRGWAKLEVEFDGVHLIFSSVEEVRHVIDVLSKNPLPTTRRLSQDRGTTMGPNSHWLSRLPSKAKSLAFRLRLVPFLEEACEKFV